ncbi:MAG: glycoside hydrolase family protein [Draconibacterium sp.]
MNRLFYLALLFVIFTACTNQKKENLRIKALPVDAILVGNVLEGPSVLNDPNRFVWGASVVKGDDGRYHMLYSTWECGDTIPVFSNSWLLHSKIAYAVSDFPDHDFKFQKIVLKGRAIEGDSSAWDAQTVHNPHVKKFNGKYYLYYVGSKDPGLQAKGSPGENLDRRNRVQQNQCIGVIEFASFEDLVNGNFTRPNQPLLSPRTRVKPNNIVNPSPEGTEAKPDNIIVVNPSVVQRPSDGKYLLYFKGNIYEPNWKGVHGVALSDSPAGPFKATDQFVFDVRNEDGTFASGEDPYVWYYSKNKKFYSVLKDFTGRITSGKPGLAILESEDGISWMKLEDSFFMKKQVVLAGGDTLKVSNLERPQLLTNEAGDPVVLFAACSIDAVGRKTDGSTFNVHIPLRLE